jgi:DNA-binding CsgD family transcriptional regulator
VTRRSLRFALVGGGIAAALGVLYGFALPVYEDCGIDGVDFGCTRPQAHLFGFSMSRPLGVAVSIFLAVLVGGILGLLVAHFTRHPDPARLGFASVSGVVVGAVGMVNGMALPVYVDCLPDPDGIGKTCSQSVDLVGVSMPRPVGLVVSILLGAAVGGILGLLVAHLRRPSHRRARIDLFEQATAARPNLSEAERSVLRLLVTGADAKEIAEELGISEEEAKAHFRSILTQLEVHSRIC